VCSRHVVQCFLMPQRNVLCLYIQDGWIWLRTMLKCFGSVFVLLELSCRKLFRIWPIGTTEWEAMEIWAQIRSPKRQRQQVLSKLWNECIMLHGVKIQETVIWVTLAMKTWKLIHGITFQKTVVTEWGTDLLGYIGLVTCSMGKDITVFLSLVYEMTNIIFLVDQDWMGTFLFSKFCMPS